MAVAAPVGFEFRKEKSSKASQVSEIRIRKMSLWKEALPVIR
jgi:hypothetical protein